MPKAPSTEAKTTKATTKKSTKAPKVVDSTSQPAAETKPRAVKNKAKAAKAAKAESGETKATKPRTSSVELQEQILKFMTAKKEYSTRDIVEGLGREPGSAGGGPVVRALRKMAEEGKVKNASNEGKMGYMWVK